MLLLMLLVVGPLLHYACMDIIYVKKGIITSANSKNKIRKRKNYKNCILYPSARNSAVNTLLLFFFFASTFENFAYKYLNGYKSLNGKSQYPYTCIYFKDQIFLLYFLCDIIIIT